MITINATLAVVITGSLIPLAISLVTKSTASPKLKSLLNVLFNAVQALIVSSMLSNGSAVISKDTLILWVTGVVISSASYIGVWKPVDAAKALLPNVGLGGPTAAPEAVSAVPVSTQRSDLPA